MKETKTKILSLMAAATLLIITAIVLLISQIDYVNLRPAKVNHSEVRLMNDVDGSTATIMGENSQK